MASITAPSTGDNPLEANSSFLFEGVVDSPRSVVVDVFLLRPGMGDRFCGQVEVEEDSSHVRSWALRVHQIMIGPCYAVRAISYTCGGELVELASVEDVNFSP